MASVARLDNTGYNPPQFTQRSAFGPFPRLGAEDCGSLLGFQPLEMDIDVIRTETDYHRYRLANRASEIDPNADLSIHKLKRNGELLYPGLEPL